MKQVLLATFLLFTLTSCYQELRPGWSCTGTDCEPVEGGVFEYQEECSCEEFIFQDRDTIPDE